MGESKAVKLTAEQAAILFKMSQKFVLPHNVPDMVVAPIERGQATEEVRLLYSYFRSISPVSREKERLPIFGDANLWTRTDGANGSKIFELKDNDVEVDVSFTDDTLSGAVWCLVLAMHPNSPFVFTVGEQVDALWPMAERLSRSDAIREMISSMKVAPRRWKDNAKPEPKKEA